MTLRTPGIILHQLFQVVALLHHKRAGVRVVAEMLYELVNGLPHLLVCFADLSFLNQLLALLFEKGRNLHQLPLICLEVLVHCLYLLIQYYEPAPDRKHKSAKNSASSRQYSGVTGERSTTSRVECT